MWLREAGSWSMKRRIGRRSRRRSRSSRKKEGKKEAEDSLDQSIMDIIHSPSTIPQMSTDRMSEVVGLHNGSEGVHESFKTAVD
jgi:hypothetical protein